jgi:hypothetical protein
MVKSKKTLGDKMVGRAWLLVILNSLDGFATYVGITTYIISEANPLLAKLDPFNILMIKLYLSTFLAVYILQHPVHVLGRWSKLLLSVANVCYFGVFVIHIYWIGLSIVS